MLSYRHRILPTKCKLYKMKLSQGKKVGCVNRKMRRQNICLRVVKKTWSCWNFVEKLLGKYEGDKYYYLNDSNKLLGYGKQLKFFSLFIIAKVLRTIWVSRCKHLSEPKPIRSEDLCTNFKQALRRTVSYEKQRLPKHDFLKWYTKNNALCKISNGQIIFCF